MCSIYIAQDSRIIVVSHIIRDFLHVFFLFFIFRLNYKCFLSFSKPKSRKCRRVRCYPIRLVLNNPILISNRLQWFNGRIITAFLCPNRVYFPTEINEAAASLNVNTEIIRGEQVKGKIEVVRYWMGEV